MKSIHILGVRIDRVTIDQASDQVERWVRAREKHYITTPNVEFVMLAQKDDIFRSILEQSDMAIPDSARFSWAQSVLCEKNMVYKLFKWPLFFFPTFFKDLPTTTGTDLMEKLIKLSNEKGFRIGLFGGRDGLADKLAKCLKKEYPNLKVSFATSGGVVKTNGEWDESKLPGCDILFVALGQGKQEKWVKRYMEEVDAKVFMGVGGAFDYLSGDVARAFEWIRRIGFEWLFRLFIQPWRIKRFSALLKFVFAILKAS